MDLGELEKNKWAIPVIIFLVAFLPRVYYMNDGLFHTDSVFQAMAVEKTVATGRMHYMHAPGYAGQVVVGSVVFLFHKIMAGADSAEWAVTFTSVLTGSLAVVMMHLFTRRLTGSTYAGFYAALAFSFAPVFLSITTFAKSHGTETLFMLLASYLAVDAGKTGSRDKKIYAGIALGFDAAVRVTSFMLAPVLLLFFWIRKMPIELVRKDESTKLRFNKKPKDIVDDALLLLVPAIVVFILPNIPYFMTEGLEPFTSISSYAGFMGPLSPILDMSLSWMYFSITGIGAVLILAGTYFGAKNSRKNTAILALWAILFTTYLGNLNISTPRYLIPAMLPLFALMGVGFAGIGESLRERWDSGHWISLGILVVMAAFMFNSIHPLLEYRKDYCGPKQFSLKIKEHTPSNAVVIGMDESQHYIYYAERKPMGHPITSDIERLLTGPESMEYIAGLLLNGTPVYVTYPQGLSYDVPVPIRYDPNERRVINGVNGVIYDKIDFNPDTRLFFDKLSKETLPSPRGASPGAYALTLFNTFNVTKVMQAENEDWHRKSIQSGRETGILYSISFRPKKGV